MNTPDYSYEFVQRFVTPLTKELYEWSHDQYYGRHLDITNLAYPDDEVNERYKPPTDQITTLALDGLIESKVQRARVNKTMHRGSYPRSIKRGALLVQQQFVIPESVSMDAVRDFADDARAVPTITFGTLGILEPHAFYSPKYREAYYPIDPTADVPFDFRVSKGLTHVLSRNAQYEVSDAAELQLALDETKRLMQLHATELQYLREIVDGAF